MDDIRQWLNSSRNYKQGVEIYLQHCKDPLLKQLFQEEHTEFKQRKLHQVMEALAKTATPAAAVITAPPVEKKKQPGPVAQKIKKLEKTVERLNDEVEELEIDKYDLEEENEKLSESVEEWRDKIDKLKKSGSPVARGWPMEMDDVVKKLYDEWLPLFVERKYLQATVYEVALAGQKDENKKKEAGAMTHRILDLRDACRSLYQKRDHYLEHKTLPQEQKLIDLPADAKRWPLTYQNYKRYLREYTAKLKKIPLSEASEKKIDDIKKQIAKYQWGVAELKKLMGIE
jgi:archaellum component FlaC